VLRAFDFHAASEPTEFALLKQLLRWQQAGAINMQLHTTRTHGLPAALQEAGSHQQQQQTASDTAAVQGAQLPHVVRERIGNSHLRAAVQHLRSGSSSGMDVQSTAQDVVAYVSGPPQMSDNVVKILMELGLSPDSVHTERWW
jgi:hypothetical protein